MPKTKINRPDAENFGNATMQLRPSKTWPASKLFFMNGNNWQFENPPENRQVFYLIRLVCIAEEH